MEPLLVPRLSSLRPSGRHGSVASHGVGRRRVGPVRSGPVNSALSSAAPPGPKAWTGGTPLLRRSSGGKKGASANTRTPGGHDSAGACARMAAAQARGLPAEPRVLVEARRRKWASGLPADTAKMAGASYHGVVEIADATSGRAPSGDRFRHASRATAYLVQRLTGDEHAGHDAPVGLALVEKERLDPAVLFRVHPEGPELPGSPTNPNMLDSHDTGTPIGGHIVAEYRFRAATSLARGEACG